MSKIKVILDTQSAITEFVSIATSINDAIYLEDDKGLRVDAKSLMGVMYGISEFKNLYVLSNNDTIATKFRKFMI